MRESTRWKVCIRNLFYFTCVLKFPPIKSIFCTLGQKHQYYCKNSVFFQLFMPHCITLPGESNLLQICVVFAFSGLFLGETTPSMHYWEIALASDPHTCQPSISHLHSAAHISAHLDIPVYLSVGGPSGTKANPLTRMRAEPGYTRLSHFRNRLNLTAGFAVFKEVE